MTTTLMEDLASITREVIKEGKKALNTAKDIATDYVESIESSVVGQPPKKGDE